MPRSDAHIREFATWLLRVVAVCLAVAVLVELVGFNRAHWSTLGLSQERSELTATPGPGLEKQADGSWLVSDQATAYFDLDGTLGELKTLNVPAVSRASRDVTLGLAVDDEGDSLLYSANASFVVNGDIPQTCYLTCSFRGEVTALRVSVDMPTNSVVEVGTIRANVAVPLALSIRRLLGVFALALVIGLLRPGSRLYRVCAESLEGRVVFGVAVAAAVCLIVAVVGSMRYSSAFNNSEQEVVEQGCIYLNNQYDHLARALLSGRLTLDLPQASYLSTMDNPYQTLTRLTNALATSEPFYCDVAYFNGAYYSYFGVLPALVLYMPFRLLTGHALSTEWVVCLFDVMACLGFAFLLRGIVRRWFDKASVGTQCLAYLAMLQGACVLFLAQTPTLYSVPISSAMALSVWGLALWVRADDGERLSRARLVGGAVLIALTLACRPQYMLTCLLAIPLFWDAIVCRRQFFSRGGVVNTLCVMVPFVVVAIPVMAYNAARFGSVFDFGANYNLTGNDMTTRGFMLSRFPRGIFAYLLAPLSVDAQFPFCHAVSTSSSFVGMTSTEPMIGGLFACVPSMLLVFGLPRVRERLSKRGVLGMVIVALVLAALIMAADIQVAGLTERYKCDFGWLVGIAVAFVILAGTGEPGSLSATIVGWLVLASVLLAVLWLYSDGHAIGLDPRDVDVLRAGVQSLLG